MFFGDADVEKSVLETLGKCRKTRAFRHSGGYRADLFIVFGESAELLAHNFRETSGVVGAVRRHYAVVLVGLLLRRLIPLAFDRSDVYYRALSASFRLFEKSLNCGAVVSVDRSEIPESEIFEIVASVDHIFEELFHVADAAEKPLSDKRYVRYNSYRRAFGAQVVATGAKFRHIVCEAADIFRYRHFVFVYDDDKFLLFVYVVERFVDHTAGVRAVADHGNRVSLRTVQSVRLGEPYRRRQRR